MIFRGVKRDASEIFADVIWRVSILEFILKMGAVNSSWTLSSTFVSTHSLQAMPLKDMRTVHPMERQRKDRPTSVSLSLYLPDIKRPISPLPRRSSVPGSGVGLTGSDKPSIAATVLEPSSSSNRVKLNMALVPGVIEDISIEKGIK